MGSLVAGWDSKKYSKGLETSRSFTEDEIELFWKARRQHQVQELHQPDAATYPRTHALKILEEDTLSAEEKKKLAKDWWRRSNYAFLNAPPDQDNKDIREGKYTTQFDVAQRAQASQDMGFASS